jgi:hypothetical protein
VSWFDPEFTEGSKDSTRSQHTPVGSLTMTAESRPTNRTLLERSPVVQTGECPPASELSPAIGRAWGYGLKYVTDADRKLTSVIVLPRTDRGTEVGHNVIPHIDAQLEVITEDEIHPTTETPAKGRLRMGLLSEQGVLGL